MPPGQTIAPTLSGAPSPGAGRLSRDDLIRLGRAGRPWGFLAPGSAAAGGTGADDAELHALLALNFVAVGLRTPAREHLARSVACGAAAEDVERLRETIERLAPDALPMSRRTLVCRANAGALATRGVDVRKAFERWAAEAGDVEFLRARDGNIVRRRIGGEWIRLRDEVGEAARLRLPAPEGEGATGAAAAGLCQFVVEGVDPPWLLRRVVGATAPAADGFGARVAAVQADMMEFLDGLSLADLRKEIGTGRVVFFAGPGAGERLREDLRARFELSIRSVCIAVPTARERLAPGATAIVEEALAEQASEQGRVVARVRAAYAVRDRAWWARRYSEAGAGRGARLRVLIPTSRYTTFVQHAARDLAAALEGAGCETRVLAEPDDWSVLSGVAYSRAFAEFEPDLVVLINYPRERLGGAAPAEVPFVCWVQDAMAHLSDARTGAAQGELDFLAGVTPSSLFEQFGYPRGRSMAMPVVASARKFHIGPVSEELLGRHACEISYASHHGETPEALHARQVKLFEGSRIAQGAVVAMKERALEFARDPMRGPVYASLRSIVVDAAREAGAGDAPDGRLVAVLMEQAALPLADRALRHGTLGWAADVAERRGWRLRIYGRGWESHPRFGAYAHPALAHGEELRACHRASAVHLHTSIHMLTHQRVLECALSGGLPVCRLHADELTATRCATTLAALARGRVDRVSLAGGLQGLRTADSADLMRYASMVQRLGLDADAVVWAARGLIERGEAPAPERQALWTLGDAPDVVFRNAGELERIVERAIERPTWRENMSALMRKRIGATLTHDVFAARLLEFIRASLDDAGAAP